MLEYVMLGAGLVAGSFITVIVLRIFFTCGNLNVDLSDPDDGPYLFLELSKELGSLLNKKLVIFSVSIRRYFPHK